MRRLPKAIVAVNKTVLRVHFARSIGLLNSSRTAACRPRRTPSRWTPTSARGPSTGRDTRRRCAWSRARRHSVRGKCSCPGATGCTAASTATRRARRGPSAASNAATLPRTCPWDCAASTSIFCRQTPSRTRCAPAIAPRSRCSQCGRGAAEDARATGWRSRRAPVSRGGEGAERPQIGARAGGRAVPPYM